MWVMDEDTGTWYDDGEDGSGETAETGLEEPPVDDEDTSSAPGTKTIGGIVFTQREDGKWVDDQGTVITDSEAQAGADMSGGSGVMGEIWNFAKSMVPKDANGNYDIAKLIGAAGLLAKVLNPASKEPKPITGWQGGIPDLVMSRAAVADNPDRRPGGAGALPFTGAYFTKPEDAPATMNILKNQAAEMSNYTPVTKREDGSGYGDRGGAGGTAVRNMYDPNNPASVQAMKDGAWHITNLINSGKNGEAVDYYNRAQKQFKFTDDDFSNFAYKGSDPSKGKFTVQDIGAWKTAANRTTDPNLDEFGNPKKFAKGGIADLTVTEPTTPRYLRGETDGMADQIPARIDGGQEARLAHGEFVIPADVVSHLGNGNSDAGAKKLYGMMDKIRVARTGNPKQGKEIDADKHLAFATGGIADLGTANTFSVRGYADGGAINMPGSNGQGLPPDPARQQALKDGAAHIQTLINSGKNAEAVKYYNDAQQQFGFTDEEFTPFANKGSDPSKGQFSAADVAGWKAGTTGVKDTGLGVASTAKESSPLASWAGKDVTNAIGKGIAVGNDMMQNPSNYIYQGDRTAGISALQQQAMDAASGLTVNKNVTDAATGLGALATKAGNMQYTAKDQTSQYTKADPYATTKFDNQYKATDPYVAGNATSQYKATDPYTFDRQDSQYTKGDKYQAEKQDSTFTAAPAYMAEKATSSYDPVKGYTAGTVNNLYNGLGQYDPAKFDTKDFTGGEVSKYMNPYLQQSLDPQLAEARRQADISRMTNSSRLVGAGAFGGGRQAVMEAEADRNLQQQLAAITGKGYDTAYNTAREQFNTSNKDSESAQKNTELSRQFGADLGLKDRTNAATFGYKALDSTEASKQFAANLDLQNSTNKATFANQAAAREQADRQLAAQIAAQQAATAAQYAQAARTANQQDRQFGATQDSADRTNAATFGQQAINANNQNAQFGATTGIQNATNAANFGQQATALNQQDRQFGATTGIQNAQNTATFGQQANTATEQSAQFGANNTLQNNQNAATFGQQAINANNQNAQFGANLGINALNSGINALNSQGALGNTAFNQGITALNTQATLGNTQRDIEQQGITADMTKFNQTAALPGQAVQYQLGLFNGMPITNNAG